MSAPTPEPEVRERGFIWRLAVLWVALQLAYHLAAALPFAQPLISATLRGVAQAAAAALQFVGESVTVVDATLLGDHPLAVARNCDAAPYFFLWIAAVVAFPAPWRYRGVALIGGCLLLAAMNVLRIAALYTIRQSAPTWFEFAHLQLADAFFVVLAAAGFLCWIARLRGSRAAPLA